MSSFTRAFSSSSQVPLPKKCDPSSTPHTPPSQFHPLLPPPPLKPLTPPAHLHLHLHPTPTSRAAERGGLGRRVSRNEQTGRSPRRLRGGESLSPNPTSSPERQGLSYFPNSPSGLNPMISIARQSHLLSHPRLQPPPMCDPFLSWRLKQSMATYRCPEIFVPRKTLMY